MRIYRRKTRRKTPRAWFAKASETVIKCTILLCAALIPTLVVVTLWYGILFQNEIHADGKEHEIIVAAWIPTFGVMYALFAGVAISWVAGEYKEMRFAVKTNNLAVFMEKKDEDLSPLMHVFITILALTVLGGFLFLDYSSAVRGAFFVGGATFVFSLLCMVVIEMDDPCYGLWVIKSIPHDWLEMDCKEWRQKHYFKKRRAARKKVTTLHVIENQQKVS
jgi:hypothetical protein